MSLGDPVDALTDALIRLDDAGVSYMITGSVAALFYGLNRYTDDTDIVVELDARHIDPLMDAFGGDYYIDRPIVEEAARLREMFNVISLRFGGKFDLIPLRDEPSEHARFGRRMVHDWHGYPVWVISPPDLVLSKLEWARESRSQRQFADIRAIMAAGFVDESDDYFQLWLRQLDLGETLDACRKAGYDS
jgi:hypothetical protein